MVRSSFQNRVDTFVENWPEIGALMPTSPCDTPIVRHRHISVRAFKRRPVPSSTMVTSAIKTLMRNPRAGVSFTAIKKYIVQNYCDTILNVNSRFRFVKRYIKSSLEKGELIRTKGVGVAGSFRLPYKQRKLHKKQKKIMKKKKKQSKTKKVKALRKKVQQKLKEMSLNGKRSHPKIKSNVGDGEDGENGDGKNDADHGLITFIKAAKKSSEVFS
ncbi:histone H1-like isoform X1 [Anastrepha ludens]|uniref:histone H1-like isoform X1 n=1 Tax=Anastrepha ludens TaxID=28586 RepID=UPI0023B0701F|nr:histone H1-like isoform X1 [Anastrepha ludens]